MNVRSITVIILAIVSGICAVVGVSKLRPRPSAFDTIETVPVLVAKADVSRSRMISAEVVELRPWPKEFVPANALTSVEDAVNRATIAPLVMGEIVLDGK